jgi:sugar lactone lactonase YvrE
MGSDKQGPNKFLYRVKDDGSDLRKALPDPIGYLYDISPDGKLAPVISNGAVAAYPIDGGIPITLCEACGSARGENRGITPPMMSWSRDGKFVYLRHTDSDDVWSIPLRPDQSLPSLPPKGVGRSEISALPGAHLIPQALAFAGSNPSVYAFARVTTHRNIYRIPVP